MTKTFETTQERASYGIGRQLGDQLAKKPFPDFDTEAAVAGFVDGMNTADLAVDADDINAAFKVIQEQLQSQKAEQEQELGAAGAAFLAENANKDGVTVLPSGLQYTVLVEGSGDKPSKESTVRTHYHGTLIDGTIFDSSVDRGVPAEFPVGGVIAGWTEALQLMPVGSKWRLFVPHNLAYGERGAGGKIGPYTTLIFDVELIDIIA
jgi:FKBP-type peptidyl-prolyl cis-trans isomerase FklB